MINQEKFEFILEKYGHYASWAIWADVGEKPKSNIGDLSVFDINHNPGLLEQLNPDVIFVGLNVSRGLMEDPLANFHDARPEAMDFKIRYALRGSPFWGAYMTDIIKDFDQKESRKVWSYLRTNKQFENENARLFHEEINDSVLKILIIHLRNFYQDRMYCIHVPFAYTSHPEGPFCKAVIKVVIIFGGVHSQFQKYQL